MTHSSPPRRSSELIGILRGYGTIGRALLYIKAGPKGTFAKAAPDKEEEDNADGQSRYSRDEESCRSPSQGTREGRRHQGRARPQARDREGRRQGSPNPRPDRRDARHHQLRSFEKGGHAAAGRDNAEESGKNG